MENFIKDDRSRQTTGAAEDSNKLLADTGFMKEPEKQEVQSQEPKSGDVVPGRYIVKLKDNQPARPGAPDPVDKIMNKIGLLPSNDTLIYRNAMNGFATKLNAQQKAALQADPDVAYIEEDKVITINPINVGQVKAAASGEKIPSGIVRIEGDKSPTAIAGGNVDVDIAVIDTGINLKHSDLNVVDNVSFVPNVKTGDDDHGHGSHVAGTIGALKNGKGVVGVAPGARLWAVKTLSGSGSGTISQVIAGVDYVTKNADKIEVANMSLGGREQSKALDEAISASVKAGVTYVVAAGNDSRDAQGYSPANHPDVITVSSMADSDGKGGAQGGRNCNWEGDDKLSSFSNYGQTIEIAAPGSCVESTWKPGWFSNDGYNTISGTSMAAPHVAGAAGLVKAKNPSYSPEQVRDTLNKNAKSQSDPDFGFSGDKDSFPEPMLNVKNL